MTGISVGLRRFWLPPRFGRGIVPGRLRLLVAEFLEPTRPTADGRRAFGVRLGGWVPTRPTADGRRAFGVRHGGRLIWRRKTASVVFRQAAWRAHQLRHAPLNVWDMAPWTRPLIDGNGDRYGTVHEPHAMETSGGHACWEEGACSMHVIVLWSL